MKNKIICRQLDFTHISNVEEIITNSISVKSKSQYYQFFTEDNINYSSQSQTTEAGVILNETVTVKIAKSEKCNFLNIALKYYVIKLYTDTNTFIVGSIDYPTEMTYNEDKIHVNLTFKSSKPI